MEIACAEGRQSWTPPATGPEGHGLLVVSDAVRAYLDRYGGLAFSSDCVAALDERGVVELTRRGLSSRQARR